jgi:hypothetical protein
MDEKRRLSCRLIGPATTASGFEVSCRLSNDELKGCGS